VAVLPDYPNGLQDWTCTAFPNDSNSVDSFLVGLIALAVAIPVSVFIAACFDVANDSEAPESWLEWAGWRKLVFGFNAHRRWHYTRGAPPARYVKWYVRSASAPPSETAANLWRSFAAWVTGTETRWVIEARHAAEAEAEEAEGGHADAGGKDDAAAEEEDEAPCSHDTRSATPSVRSARGLAAYKRRVMLLGLGATAVCWALFTWFIFTCAHHAAHGGAVLRCWHVRVAVRCVVLRSPRPRPCGLLACHARTDGMLIYRLLGEDAEQSFARSWGISYGLSAAQEWKDIAKEAAKAALILAILERFHATSAASWLEARRRLGGRLRCCVARACVHAWCAGSRACSPPVFPTATHRLLEHSGAAGAPPRPQLRGADQSVLEAHQAPIVTDVSK
jgi:hypothetical protein